MQKARKSTGKRILLGDRKEKIDSNGLRLSYLIIKGDIHDPVVTRKISR